MCGLFCLFKLAMGHPLDSGRLLGNSRRINLGCSFGGERARTCLFIPMRFGVIMLDLFLVYFKAWNGCENGWE